MNNTPIKYFLYARKSTEGDDKQITSIQDQVSELKNLAKKLNIEIVDIITESKSAKEPGGREKFNTMLQEIEKMNEPIGILCWRLNRLARNPLDGAKISWMLQKKVIHHIQTFGAEYKPTDNVIMMSVEFGLSNQYVKDLSIDVKRGMRTKAQKGWYPAPHLPIGYTHNPTKGTSKEIIKDKKRFKIVSELWQLLLSGIYSVADLKRVADEKGLINRNGNPYSLNTFYLLFNNEFYYGNFYWANESSEKVRHFGKHIPMISSAQYRKAQEILGNNSIPTRKREYFFPYRGLIRCGECNGSVTAENKLQAICTHCKHKFSIKTKKFCPKCKMNLKDMNNPSIIDKTYYHCTKKIKKNCTQGSITEPIIESFMQEQLDSISINQEFYDFAMKTMELVNQEAVEEDKKLIIPLKKRRTELQTRIQNLIQMRADAEIDSRQFKQMNTDTKNEIDLLSEKIETIESGNNQWLKVVKEKFDFMLKASDLFKNADKKLKKQLASKIGSNLTLKDKSLYFIWDIGTKSIMDCATAYMQEKSMLEPEIPIDNTGDFDSFNLLFPRLLAQLKAIRTCQIDNF